MTNEAGSNDDPDVYSGVVRIVAGLPVSLK